MLLWNGIIFTSKCQLFASIATTVRGRHTTIGFGQLPIFGQDTRSLEECTRCFGVFCYPPGKLHHFSVNTGLCNISSPPQQPNSSVWPFF